MTKNFTPLDVDILIAGGGLVGGSLSCALADAGFSVAVVDTMLPSDGLDEVFDGRSSAIALASKRLLDGVGLWSLMEHEAQPIEDIRVSDGRAWGHDSLFFLHYDHHDTGEEGFGFMLENRHIRQALFKRMKSLETLHMLAPARIDRLERNPGRVEATLENGHRISASLVIGAEGRKSPTRETAGIKIFGWDYRQSGIVCTVEHALPHDSIAHERFLPAGPFAILPLQNNRSSIVWTERSELAPSFMSLDDASFLRELGARFGDFLGELKVAGGRWCYPLSLQLAERATDHRLALVGDAWHGMHPIAGQGLNMGLRDVAWLAEILVDAKRVGSDPGGKGVLATYEQHRRFDNTAMLAVTDGLNRLFSNDLAPVRMARDIGLAAVNEIRPLKKALMMDAMGLGGKPPRLMRDEPL